MNISGVLLHVIPRHSARIRQTLDGQPGVEVHAASAAGRVVVTVEHDDARRMAETVAGMQNIPGVLSAAMIYHHYEDESTAAQQAQIADPVPAVLKTDFGNEEASK